MLEHRQVLDTAANDNDSVNGEKGKRRPDGERRLGMGWEHKEEGSKRGTTVQATGGLPVGPGGVFYYGDRVWGAYSGIEIVEMCRGH